MNCSCITPRSKCSSSSSSSSSNLLPSSYQQQIWAVPRTNKQISFSGFVASLLLGNWRNYLDVSIDIKTVLDRTYLEGYLRLVRFLFNEKKFDSEIVSLSAAGCQVKIPDNFLEAFNNHFSAEILDYIFQYLPPEDLRNAQLVCHQWRNLVDRRQTHISQKVISSLFVSYDRKVLRISKSSGSLAIFGGSLRETDLSKFINTRIVNMDISVHGVLEDLDELYLTQVNVENLSIYFYNGFEQDESVMHNFVDQLSHNNHLISLQLICFGDRKGFPEWFEQTVSSKIENVQFKCY